MLNTSAIQLNAVVKKGTGNHAVVCLNGWFGCSTEWGDWQNNLNTTDFTWYFPDYRGYGTRLDVQGVYTLDEIAADFNALLTQIPQHKITLLGHSMGGMFMQRLLLDCPRPIHSLIGISPVPATGTPLPPEQKSFFASAGENAATRRAIIDITTGNRLPAVWLDRMQANTVANSKNAAVAGYFSAWADSNIFAALGSLEEKILVIVGSHDPAVTKSAVEATYAKTFKNIEIVELPDCGHYAMDEIPLSTAALIEEFLLKAI